MPKTECPECGIQVWDQAVHCPECKHQFREKPGIDPWVRRVIMVIVTLFAGILGKELVKFYYTEPDVRSRAYLLKVASQMNQYMPMMVSDNIEMWNASADKGVIIYNYRCLSIAASRAPAGWIEANRASLANAVCTTPETRDAFLKKGIKLRYVYHNKDRVHLGRIEISPSDCGFETDP